MGQKLNNLNISSQAVWKIWVDKNVVEGAKIAQQLHLRSEKNQFFQSQSRFLYRPTI